MKKKIGIYKVTCMKNGKIRIGHTKGDFAKRFSVYKAQLRHGYYLGEDMQNDWNNYGEENFNFEIIENCKMDELKERENYYIVKYDSIENGYNTDLNDLSKPKKSDEVRKLKHLKREEVN